MRYVCFLCAWTSEIDSDMQNKVKYNVGKQAIGFSHNPMAPCFYERPQHHKRTYDVLHFACERLKEYYFEPRDNWLPNLEFARDSNRQTRSERREAIAAVGQVMANYVDMATLKVAFWKKEGSYPISVELLAQLAKLSRRRCERALVDMKRAGYLEFDYRVKTLADGSLQPMVAIKRLAKLFFYHLGISFEKLRQVQEYAKKKFAKFSKKLRMQTAASKGALHDLFGRGRKRGTGPKKPFSDTSITTTGPPKDLAQKKRYGELLYLLSQQYPDWPHDKVRTEANMML